MAKKNRQKSFAHSASSASSQLSQLHKSPSSNTVNSTTTPAGQSSPGDSHDSPYPHSSLTSASSSHQPPSQPKSLYHWIHSEREGFFWILGCAFVGALLGFGVGCGWFTGGSGTYQMVLKTTARSGAKNVAKSYEQEYVVTEWRMALAERIRKTAFYEVGTFRRNPWNVLFSERGEGGVGKKGGVSGGNGGMSGGNSADDDYWASFTRGDGSETKTVTAPLPSLIPGEIQEYAHSPQARDAYKRNIVKGKNRNESTSHSIQPSRTFLRNFWPQNWSLFSNLDADRGDTSDGALSPLMVSFFSFILPWKRRTIQALARKDSRINNDEDNSFYYADPYFHPMAFAVLREHVVRFEKGYVHPDLGFLVPAPSGASRGLGMVRDSYNKCQVQCYPGSAEEAKSRDRKEQNKNMQQNQTVTYEQIQATLQRQSTATTQQYTQSDILLHIPLEAQITRSTALRILTPLLPKGNVNLANSINELDDGPLLALLLAHERALGSDSRFYPYIATLPLHPSCGWNPEWRQSVVDVVTAMSVQMGTDVQGWPAEIAKAADMADRISRALGRDYGSYLAARQDGGGGDVTESIRWSLCQVSSRAIAGRESYGSLRLVPILDMVNHDAEAGKFVELTGEESLEKGDFLDAEEDDAGAFVLRSRRHGRKKALRRGQELLANYNVPFYSPLDWFLNMGYIPPERAGKWTMIDAGLPRTQRGGYSRSNNVDLQAQSGAFGSGKPEVQVIQNRHSQEITQQSVGGECDSNQHGTCQR